MEPRKVTILTSERRNSRASLIESRGRIDQFVKWKFIDLNLTLTYSLEEGSRSCNGYTIMAVLYVLWRGVPSYYKLEDMWKQEGDNAKLPKFKYGNSPVPSSRWLMPTDYLPSEKPVIGFLCPQRLIV
ncbi:hypothetical protein NXV62_22680 [Bacteroides fragilis]|nr:hypothetical protein [Bacteroides fragilis]